MVSRECPALLISAPASNQGKTTVTAALARYHRRNGLNVRIFKTGPDFLDPMILAEASGNEVGQLDLWMVGEADCRRMLYEAAQDADLILVEGVMGLYDGEPSSADLAELFNIPVACVIDVHGMAQTFNAVAHGLRHYRPNLPFAGVIANGIASVRHAQMLLENSKTDVLYLGGLSRDAAIKLPDRHLGLVQASEVGDLNEKLDAAADLIEAGGLHSLPDAVSFSMESDLAFSVVPELLRGVTIAVARDLAFSFIYNDNLKLLSELGAQLVFFSPLSDSKIPAADALYLPGGYPELHLAELAKNQSLCASVRQHFESGKKIYAECGGMLYLMDSLTNKDGIKVSMIGLIAGDAVMQNKLSALGYQSIEISGEVLRGHTFHHSLTTFKTMPELAKKAYATRRADGADGETIITNRGLFASYVHLYFRSNPLCVARLFKD